MAGAGLGEGGLDDTQDVCEVFNPDGRAPYLLVVDHASNFFPDRWGDLGLSAEDRSRHIAWDPGARPVAEMMAGLIDAPLVAAKVSRLVVDVNRPIGSTTMMPEISEDTVIAGNVNLSAAERQARIETVYEPYHRALAAVVERQVARCGDDVAVIAVHSFTPVYKGNRRDLHLGVLFDSDDRLGRQILEALGQEDGLIVRANEPYSPSDEVYYTLGRHAQARGLQSVMLEIRNDLIGTEDACRTWAERLVDALKQ